MKRQVRRIGVPLVTPKLKADVLRLKAEGLTQTAIAVHLRTSQTTVSRIVRGDR